MDPKRQSVVDDIEVLQGQLDAAMVLRRQGLTPRALPALESVVDRLARSRDPDAPTALQAARHELALAYRELRRPERARELWMQCLAVLEVRHGSRPHAERGQVLLGLSTVTRELADHAAAERYGRRGLAEWTSLRDGEDADIAIAKATLGAALLAQGRLPDAEALLIAAVGTAEVLGAEIAIVHTLTHVGTLAQRRSDVAGARGSFTRALKLARKHFPESAPEVRELVASLARLG